ncbi:MAG: type IV-A pilus assembly ATPase PilB [Thioalkalivibrionaceae bacterium]
MSTDLSTPRLQGLAKRLVDKGLLSEDAARNLSEKARQEGILIYHLIVRDKPIDESQILINAAEEFGFPALDITAFSTDGIPKELINEKLIRKHRALPLLARGNRLFLATSDPTNATALADFKFSTNLVTEPVLVEASRLDAVIERVLTEVSAAAMEGADDESLDNLTVTDTEAAKVDITQDAVNDAPIVRYVNKVLFDAVQRKASDIHLEPFEKKFRVRYRIDGVLHEVASPPQSQAMRITSRVKVMSKMDIAERRVPQDGRIRMKISNTRFIDFRVNSLPTIYGEKIVLRILDPDSAALGIDKLGYEEHQKELYLKALSKPYGMILVTGPTGSGKTVSLYTGLGILNTPDRNISTAEDPSEINMPGVNQVNINNKVGLTFASALRAFLRQDPDVIMVGEIRDLETAEIAIKAAQTGHLVLSTLHTNDAPQTLTRLANMGVPPYNIASSILLIIAQRLARRLCSNCKQTEDLPPEVLRREGFTEDDIRAGITVYKAVGCDQCTQGYKGRVGIYQVLPISEKMKQIILSNGNAEQLAQCAADEGIPDLRRSGLEKVKQGVTSLEEINRVTVD